jgi:hypothetical protein
VKDGLASERLRDCSPDLGHGVVAELFYLWYVLASVQLGQEHDDKFMWS